MWYDKIEFKHKTCMDKYNECNPIKENVISLYVVMTRKCNVNCPFCEFTKGSVIVDIEQFEKLYKELRQICYISTVHFTGGEPTLELDKIKRICNIVKESDDFTQTSVNTNGIFIEKLEGIYELDNISLSRHHYDDSKNIEIFGNNSVPTVERISNFKEKNKLHLSCNLIKGYIDNEVEIQKYLDFAGNLDIHDIGVVSLMGINDYCINNFVSFENIDLSKIPNLCNSRCYRKFKENTDLLLCRCDNYLYTTSDMKLVSMYHRYAIKNDEIADCLVYENNHIKQGFNGIVLV